MLKLRGIDLGREPHDIDILICDYAFNLVVPKNMIFEDLGIASDGCGQKYKYDDVIIDVISNGEEPELVNGIRLGTVEKLMQQKYHYSLQNNDQSKKHHEDLVKMGFVFPEPESITRQLAVLLI